MTHRALVDSDVATGLDGHRVRLRFHPTAAGAARMHLTRFLTANGVRDDVVDDVRLVVSELVANAVQHGRPISDGYLMLGWLLEKAHLVLSVEDGGDQPVEPREAGPEATGGRGLHIIDSLARSWSVRRDGGTTLVCAKIALTG